MKKPLPPILLPFEKQIAEGSRPFVAMLRHPDPKTEPCQSCMGGLPYLPHSLTYPTDETGQPLDFIAQFNFTEMPPLPGFPEKGLLQFFVSHLLSTGLTTRFFQEPFEEPVVETDLQLMLQYAFPQHLPKRQYVQKPGRLLFEEDTAPPDATDFHFQEFFGSGFLENAGHEITNAYSKFTENGRRNKLGGDGRFVQGDPRTAAWAEPFERELQVLMQLYSSDDFGLMWGDCQELCFFVFPDDLQQQNFSNLWLYLCP